MTRKTVRLTVDLLAQLPEPQRTCLFWELGPVDRHRVETSDRAREKERHLSAVLREWGSCGRVVLVEGAPVGFAIYAPPAWLPGGDSLPTSPTTPDAVLLGDLWVERSHRGGGLGRLLIQGVARDLVERGHPALETYGDTRALGGSGLVPTDFLGSVGFKTQRAHPTTPRMRMELRSTLSWKTEVEQALEKLWGVVRPAQQKAARPLGGSVRGSARAASGEAVELR